MFTGEGLIGSPFVVTSSNGGHSPEAIAELCVNRLIQISDKAHPVLRDQAHAFRDQMLKVVVHYVKMAMEEDRATMCAKIREAGFPDLASNLRRL
jgi:hypothetical protein